MPDIVQVLSDAVANQIAAGEVVQRPASVVKELVENAVDAGATRIQVLVKDAGKTLIQVVDNGTGMSPADAERCFERHATSKIRSAEDLFSITTRGFRGEALASMAAVAEVSLKTRSEESSLGTSIRIAASETQLKQEVQCPQGANFQVRNLFFNIPARRKFLKSDQTELRHIINEFNHVALTHPEVEFRLTHNESVIYNLPVSNLRQRIIALLGKSVNNYLLALETETSLVKISGFIGKPEHARRTYGEQFFFVNGRYIKHPYFHKAVMGAYDNILAPEHYPSYFIYLETEPSRIDVNIHPSKTEVKFEDERAIWQILLASVREAIGRNNLSPSLDFNTEGVIDIPVLDPKLEVRVPEIETNPSYNPFEQEDAAGPGERRTGNQGPGGQQKAAPAGFGQQAYDLPGYTRQASGRERSESWEQLFEPLPQTRQAGKKVIQVRNKYVLSPVRSGLMVLDQRRAHERILHDRLIRALEGQQMPAQQNLFPETLDLSAADHQLCLEMLPQLEQIGFDIRDFGKHSIVVHGLPAGLKITDVKESIEILLEQYKSLDSLDSEEWKQRVARSAARTSALNYGTAMDEQEMLELIDELFACSNPNYSPGGKPIVRILELGELDEFFKA